MSGTTITYDDAGRLIAQRAFEENGVWYDIVVEQSGTSFGPNLHLHEGEIVSRICGIWKRAYESLPVTNKPSIHAIGFSYLNDAAQATNSEGHLLDAAPGKLTPVMRELSILVKLSWLQVFDNGIPRITLPATPPAATGSSGTPRPAPAKATEPPETPPASPKSPKRKVKPPASPKRKQPAAASGGKPSRPASPLPDDEIEFDVEFS